MSKAHFDTPRRRWVLPLILCAAAVAVGILLCWQLVWTGGQLVPRQARYLDLRGKEVTPQAYEELHQALPNCRILWDVPFQGAAYPSDTTSLRIADLSAQDVEMLRYFPQLQQLDATDVTDYAALSDCISRFSQSPQCTIALNGTEIQTDVQTLSLTNPSLAELRKVLPLLGNLRLLELSGTLPPVSELLAFQAEYPAVTLRWNVAFRDRSISSTTTELNLSSLQLDYASAEALLSQLPLLERVNMRGCGLTDAEMDRLRQAFPQTLLVWDREIAGLRVSTDSVEIDLSGRQISDPAQVESVLASFPRLERVIMSDCGLDNETMDALNRRHEDIRFVWTVYFRWFPVRTDALYFYPYKMDHRFPFQDEFCDAELYPLRYCTDMVSIDLGHDASVYNVEWAAFMPNLRYLILTECPVVDLTPLVNCKELVYLEMTKCWWEKDLAPLVECTALEDVNLGWSYPDPEPLSKMPWLKHIWWCSAKRTIGLPCSTAKQLFDETIPDTITYFDGPNPVEGGWREFQTYYDMRDLMEMYYLR